MRAAVLPVTFAALLLQPGAPPDALERIGAYGYRRFVTGGRRVK